LAPQSLNMVLNATIHVFVIEIQQGFFVTFVGPSHGEEINFGCRIQGIKFWLKLGPMCE
jgi:hypothetical protein